MLVHRRLVRPFNAALLTSPVEFDRAFDQLVAGFGAPRRSPVVDAGWRDGSLVLTVDLPGVPAERVGVEVSARVLTLSVTAEPAPSATEAQAPSVAWQRTFKLGPALDPERVEARYANGRLSVTVAPVEVVEPPVRRIEIATAPEPAVLDTTAAESAPGESDATES